MNLTLEFIYLITFVIIWHVTLLAAVVINLCHFTKKIKYNTLMYVSCKSGGSGKQQAYDLQKYATAYFHNSLFLPT